MVPKYFVNSPHMTSFRTKGEIEKSMWNRRWGGGKYELKPATHCCVTASLCKLPMILKYQSEINRAKLRYKQTKSQ